MDYGNHEKIIGLARRVAQRLRGSEPIALLCLLERRLKIWEHHGSCGFYAFNVHFI